MSPANSLVALSDRIAGEGEPLAGQVRRSTEQPAFGRLASVGPRTSDKAGEYAFVVEAVREGYLCHYGTSRVLRDPDPDLALLAGDLFYAIGINGLAALDDPESVGILSDLIRVSAELRAEGRIETAEVLWVAQVMALSCGKDGKLEGLLATIGKAETGSTEGLMEWSAKTAASHRIGPAFDEACKAIDSMSSNS